MLPSATEIIAELGLVDSLVGVGMSQWGAEGYATHGWDYRRILAHYYPHTALGTATDPSVRVLLEEKKTTVAIGSSAPFLLVDARGRKVHVPARTLRFGIRMRLGGHSLVASLRGSADLAKRAWDRTTADG